MEKIITRSDILLAKIQANTIEEKDELIEALHEKIESVYTLYFNTKRYAEKFDSKDFDGLAKLIKRSLEVNNP